MVSLKDLESWTLHNYLARLTKETYPTKDPITVYGRRLRRIINDHEDNGGTSEEYFKAKDAWELFNHTERKAFEYSESKVKRKILSTPSTIASKKTSNLRKVKRVPRGNMKLLVAAVVDTPTPALEREVKPIRDSNRVRKSPIGGFCSRGSPKWAKRAQEAKVALAQMPLWQQEYFPKVEGNRVKNHEMFYKKRTYCN